MKEKTHEMKYYTEHEKSKFDPINVLETPTQKFKIVR